MRKQSTKFNYELLKQIKGTICCDFLFENADFSILNN